MAHEGALRFWVTVSVLEVCAETVSFFGSRVVVFLSVFVVVVGGVTLAADTGEEVALCVVAAGAVTWAVGVAGLAGVVSRVTSDEFEELPVAVDAI
jgi:hypothetical protein